MKQIPLLIATVIFICFPPSTTHLKQERLRKTIDPLNKIKTALHQEAPTLNPKVIDKAKR